MQIVKSTLSQQVVEVLKRQILSGKLAAGDRLWAADLAQELKISIAPIKEALIILEGQGLIWNVPRRGVIVREFTLEDVRELYDVRRMIEMEVVRICSTSGHVSEDVLGRLEACNAIIGDLRQDGAFTDNQAAFEQDHLFHQTLVQASGHKLLNEWYGRLNAQAQIIRFSSWHIGPRGDKTYNEHVAIIKAIRSANSTATEHAIDAHLKSIVGDFEVAIRDKQPNGLSESSDDFTRHHGRRQLVRDTPADGTPISDRVVNKRR